MLKGQSHNMNTFLLKIFTKCFTVSADDFTKMFAAANMTEGAD